MSRPSKSFWKLSVKDVQVLLSVVVILALLAFSLNILDRNQGGASFIGTAEAAPARCMHPNADGSPIDFFSGANAYMATSTAACQSGGGSVICPPNAASQPAPSASPQTPAPSPTFSSFVPPAASTTLADITRPVEIIGPGTERPILDPGIGGAIGKLPKFPPYTPGQFECGDFTIGMQGGLANAGYPNTSFVSLYCYSQNAGAGPHGQPGTLLPDEVPGAPGNTELLNHYIMDIENPDGTTTWIEPQYNDAKNGDYGHKVYKLFPNEHFTLPATGIKPDPSFIKDWQFPGDTLCDVVDLRDVRGNAGNINDNLANYRACIASGRSPQQCRLLLQGGSATYHSCIADGYPAVICRQAFPQGSPKYPW